MENLNLVQKLAKIQQMVDVVKKDKQGFNYKYSDIVEILAKVTAGMKKYGVSLLPQIVPGSTNVQRQDFSEIKFDKQGNQYTKSSSELMVTADMIYTWVDDDNSDDRIEIPWTLVGMQSDPSQAFGSGLTYTKRYFLTDFFNIAQDNDVDGYRTKQKLARADENKIIAQEIVEQINRIVRGYLDTHGDKSDEVRKFISKYVKNADYTKITDSELAGRLLNDFKEKFIKE